MGLLGVVQEGEMSLLSTDEAVARMTATDREARLALLLDESRTILANSIEKHITGDGKKLAAVCVLFSGGNDSTVLAHMFRDVATHAIHANATIGLESTRDFVRNVCEEWGLPLIEKMPPNEADHYKAQVLLHGFPGPGRHAIMFQRLKERGMRAARRDIIGNRGHRERLVFVAGRRRAESERRANVPEDSREGAIAWSAPLVNWTKPDLTTYRVVKKREGDPVPVNETAQLIHMSGECLCGSFASPGEREQLDYWFHEHIGLIRWLEAELLKPEYDHIPVYRKTWGWGAIPELAAMAPQREKKHRPSWLCEGCAPLFEMAGVA